MFNKMRAIGKKGQVGINMIVPSVLTLVLAALILIFSLAMMDSLWDSTTAGTIAYSAANKTIAGMGKFGDYWDLIVLAIIITVIISLLLVVFSMRRVQ